MKPVCVISCPIDTFSGYGARSRDFVNALIKVKGNEWDIRILPQKWGDCPWNFYKDNDPIRLRFIGGVTEPPDIWIQHTVPNEFQPIGKFNIGLTAGIETTICPKEFLDGMNKMNLNLISSKHSKAVATASQFEQRENRTNKVLKIIKLEKPCEVLFEGLDLKVFNKSPQSTDILKDIPEEFCFLYTGHWLPGRFGEDRKNTSLMVKTFLETFNTSSQKKPALILKTNQVDYSILDREEIIYKIHALRKKTNGDLPNIYLLHGELTNEEMNQLNNDPKVKAFVNFTKGEGFGRPLLESAITGKPMITTNWSGHLDFLKPEYNVLLGGELKKVHKSAANQFLLKESQWFNVNTAVASRAMKDVYKNYKKYIPSSRKQTQYLKNNFSLDKMAESLSKLLSTYMGDIPQQVALNLPKLKKVGSNTNKLNLPKLKKLDPVNKIKLPKLKKVEI